MTLSALGGNITPNLINPTVNANNTSLTLGYTPFVGMNGLGLTGNLGNVAGGLITGIGLPFYTGFSPLPAFGTGFGTGQTFDPYTFLLMRSHSSHKQPPKQDSLWIFGHDELAEWRAWGLIP